MTINYNEKDIDNLVKNVYRTYFGNMEADLMFLDDSPSNYSSKEAMKDNLRKTMFLDDDIENTIKDTLYDDIEEIVNVAREKLYDLFTSKFSEYDDIKENKNKNKDILYEDYRKR